MRTLLAFALVALLAACAANQGDEGGPTLLSKDERCARYEVALAAARLRLENPAYLSDKEAEVAKRAVSDLELAMLIAGCPAAQ